MTIGCDATLLATIYSVFRRSRALESRNQRRAARGRRLGRRPLGVGCGRRHAVQRLRHSRALMGVMFWYYFASVVVFFGGEFVHAMSEDKNAK